MNVGQLLVYPLTALIAHQPCNRHRHALDDFSLFHKDNAAFRSNLDSLNYHYEYTESDGGHIWRNWRIYLTTFVQRLFK